MKRRLKYYVVSFLLTTAAIATMAQSTRSFTVNGRNVKIDTFNRAIDEMMKEVGVPGMSLAIIDNNRIVFYNTYGTKKITTKEAVDKETIFEACSLSKSFFVFVVYKLVDEGKLDLDKPMYQYLPYPPLEHDPRYKLITPRMILCHTSGIENWRVYNNPETLDILSDPGTRYVYSGEGYEYLAKVAELLINKPYKEYIKEIVFQPLQLKRTYALYTDNGNYPLNYATGHNTFQKEIGKWKNLETSPAAGVHTTAEDYAKLIISLFNKKHISDNSVRTILTPGIKERERGGGTVYFDAGFEVAFSANDTIVSHGGDNSGFKNLMYYSVVHKRGFVFLTNSDLGPRMAKHISDMSVGLDILPYLSTFYEQYPATPLSLMRIYREKGKEAMYAKLTEMENTAKEKIDAHTLDELGILFMKEDKSVTRKLMLDNIKRYPESPLAYFTLGEVEMSEKQYASAYDHFLRSKELNIDDPDVEDNLRICKENLVK